MININNNKKKKIKKLIAITMAITTIMSSFIVDVYAAAGEIPAAKSKESHLNSGKEVAKTEAEKVEMEKIMKGLSSFVYKVYEWPKSLTVGALPFSIIEALYTKTTGDKKEMVLWNDDDLTKEMQDFYSTTNWREFTGMYETIETSNYCEALLSKEVIVYEEIMDAAADRYGFSIYKEIFKAMAQAKFNENKTVYEIAKKRGYIKGKGTDKFDLFHIDGSWLDGARNPIDKQHKDEERTDVKTEKEDFSNPITTPTPTVEPEYVSKSDLDIKSENSAYTVEESVEIAAKNFSEILKDSVFPNPYNTNALISSVQGFEFGGTSNKVKARYKESSCKLNNHPSFISFTAYCDVKTSAGSTSESENNNKEIDYDKIIERYAKVLSNGKLRSGGDKEVYGNYKYSDQKFYQKVFENYQCSGGGTMDYGQLPPDMKEILRKCMKTWDSRVTKERREIIQQGVLLYGVTYSMDYRNSPSLQNPRFLDCSSFTGQCYWRAGVLDASAAHWTTANFVNACNLINEGQLIPGDIGQINWDTGITGGAAHIGIYIGQINGTKYWLHCTGGYTDGIYHAPGKGIKINDYGGFRYYGRVKQLK